MRKALLLALAIACMGQAYGTGIGMPFSARTGRGISSGAQPIWQSKPGASDQLPSLARIDSNPTINGITPDATFRYRGQDVDATDWEAWTYGETLIPQGLSGVEYDVPVLLGDDEVIDFAAAGHYESGATTSDDSDFGTLGADEDVYLEVLFFHDASGPGNFVSKKLGATDGWAYYASGTTVLVFAVEDVDSSGFSSASAGLVDGGLHFCSFCLDRSEASTNGSRHYCNYVDVGGGTDLSAHSSTTASTTDFAVGANSAAGIATGAGIAYVGGWFQEDWFAGGATTVSDCLDTHQERFEDLFGVRPRKGGSPATTLSRASAAYTRIYDATSGETRLDLYGDNIPRVERFLDADGTVVVGLTIEPAFENEVLQSEDLGTTWTKIRATDTFHLDQYATSTGETTMDCIEASSTNQSHGIDQAVTVSGSTAYVFVAEVRGGDQEWVALSINSGGGEYAYFNTTTCTAGTSAAVDWTYAESIGGNKCRVALGYTTAASPATDRPAFYPGEADGDVTFAGDADGDPDMCFGNVVFGPAEYAPTYVKTTTVAVTRAADDLHHETPSTVDEGALVCDMVLAPGIASNARTGIAFVESTGNHIYLRLHNATPNAARFDVVDGSSTQASISVTAAVGDLGDGALHRWGLSFAPNNVVAYIDGQDRQEDTSATIPTGKDEIMWGGAAPQWAATLSDCKVYDTPGEGPIK